MTPSSLFCAKCGALVSTIAPGVIRKHGECDGQPKAADRRSAREKIAWDEYKRATAGLSLAELAPIAAAYRAESRTYPAPGGVRRERGTGALS